MTFVNIRLKSLIEIAALLQSMKVTIDRKVLEGELERNMLADNMYLRLELEMLGIIEGATPSQIREVPGDNIDIPPEQRGEPS